MAALVLLPVMAANALTVHINFGKSVLFAQDRPGKDGKLFKLYIFRFITNFKIQYSPFSRITRL